MLQNGCHFLYFCVFVINLYQSNDNICEILIKITMKNNNLKLNSIKTVYDFGNFTKSQINILNFYLSNSKYKNKFEKIRKDEKVVLDLKKNIDVFLNEIKTECNVSFFYHRSSELIDLIIEYYDLINRYDELFNAILFKNQDYKSNDVERLVV